MKFCTSTGRISFYWVFQSQSSSMKHVLNGRKSLWNSGKQWLHSSTIYSLLIFLNNYRKPTTIFSTVEEELNDRRTNHVDIVSVCYILFRKLEHPCQTKGKVAFTSGIPSYTSKQQSRRFITVSLWSALHSKECVMDQVLGNWAQAVYDSVKGKTPQVSHLKVKINPNQNLIWQNIQWYLFKYLNAIEICPSEIPKLFLKLNTDMLEAHITTGCTWVRSFNCPFTLKHWSRLSALFTWGLIPKFGHILSKQN